MAFVLDVSRSNFNRVLVVCISRHQKHDYANYDRFVPNFDMAYKTIKRVSVPNLKSFAPTKTELHAKEVREFSIMLYGKMGRGRFLLPTNMAAAI